MGTSELSLESIDPFLQDYSDCVPCFVKLGFCLFSGNSSSKCHYSYLFKYLHVICLAIKSV